MKQFNKGKSTWLTGSMALIGGVFMLLMGSKASAQVADYVGTGGTSTSVTYYSNESGTALTKTGFGTATSCGSGGLSGMTMSTSITSYASGNPHVYLTVTANAGYALHITGVSAICRSSGTGPTKARLAYSTDGGTTWTAESSDHTQSTSGSCGASTNSFSWAGGISLSGVNSIIVAVYPYSAGASGGTFQVNQFHVNGSVVATTCSGTPTAGSVSPSPSIICGSGTSLLTLSGASSGGGISYQWENSSDNVTFSAISGATDNTYITPTISSTTYYRTTTTCSVSSLSATTASATVSVNAAPSVAAISGPSTVIIGAPVTMTDATAGGVWSSSTTAVATVGTSGVVTGVAPNTSTISYTVTSGSCSTSVTQVVTVLENNTLAVYSGAGGNGVGTSVVGIANESVGTLTATGFGSNSPCGSGGLSGITVSTVYATYGSSNPHVYYQVTPDAGYQLNITGIKAITRESGTGPSLARLAYSTDGGTTWTDDATDHTQSTGGSCGAASNTFSWTSGLTVMGVTTNVLVAVYPYAPVSSTGSFQLNRLTVFGNVAPAGSCTGTTGGAANAATSFFCDNGSTTVSLSGGSAGTGITYQWQNSSDGVTFADISGATNASYNTSSLSATTYYQMVTTCAFAGTPSTSTVAIVSVNPTPSAGTITGVPSYVIIGTPSTLADATTGGVWSSSNAGVATIGSADGIVNGLIPGTSVITYSVTDGGCTGHTTANVSVIHPSTIAAYLGADGSSVATVAVSTDVTTTDVTATGFGTNSACIRGGISGLTNNGVTTFSTANAHAYFQVTPNAGFYMNVTGFHITLRRSGSGITKVRMAYSLDNGATWSDDGIDQAPDNAGCAVSTTDYSYSASLPATVAAGGDGVLFAVFPYDPIAAGGTIQVNSFDITGTVTACPSVAAITGNQVICGLGNTITLADATAGGTWSTSDASIADVDGSGVVTAIDESNAVITYTVADGVTGCYGTASVNVTVSIAPDVAAIGGDATVCVDGDTQLTEDTEDGTWSSSDNTVASVDATGDVTGVSAGTAIISYTVTNAAGCTATATVEVTVSVCGGKAGNNTVATQSVNDVTLYPNPATSVLHVASMDKVNVSIVSVDGKVMINQNNAKDINVSVLAPGIYVVKVYNEGGMLIKTARFTKN